MIREGVEEEEDPSELSSESDSAMSEEGTLVVDLRLAILEREERERELEGREGKED